MKVFNSFILLLLSASIFAQSSGLMMQSPKMPSVSPPALGNGFYTPKNSSFYSGANPIANTEDSEKTQNTGTTKTSSPSEGVSDKKTDILSDSLSKNLPEYLSAMEISNLSGTGIFNSISNLTGNYSSYSGSDKILLTQILEQLQELNKKLSENQDSRQKVSDVRSKNSSSILRFYVSQNDILPSCTTVFFSKPETDGSFLLTGDRKFSAGGKVFLETFYLFFKATGAENGSTKFTVTAELSPDNNSFSVLKPLTNSSSLTAKKSGNLVSLKTDTINLLLSLEN